MVQVDTMYTNPTQTFFKYQILAKVFLFMFFIHIQNWNVFHSKLGWKRP